MDCLQRFSALDFMYKLASVFILHPSTREENLGFGVEPARGLRESR